jgi:hypothetical protein
MCIDSCKSTNGADNLDSVDELADQNSITVDTSHLRSALYVLFQASLNLDAVRADLEKSMNRQAKIHGKLSVMHTFKEWISCKLGLSEPWDPRDGLVHRLDRETKRELEAYLLAPEHAPAMEIHQSPMNIYGKSPCV